MVLNILVSIFIWDLYRKIFRNVAGVDRPGVILVNVFHGPAFGRTITCNIHKHVSTPKKNDG